MKNNAFIIVSLFLLPVFSSYAISPGTITKHIKVDQFGYLPASKKVAVIADPQTGYNAAESFSPGTAANQYQVRRWSDDVVLYTGTLTAWNTGAIHAQSGDRGWWFDFSSVTTPGSYYIYDLTNNVGSYRFEIGQNVYAVLLKQASRMYFYQCVNFAKQPPYVDSKWADGASFGGSNQDFAARSRYDKTNPATARDVHGGWFDAGDYNKYITFALGPICNLLESYRMHPVYFTDDYNIPESGNGIADILDEVKWELDFFTRMQDASGTNGLLLKVGADNFNSASPPSADNNPRYYVPECTSATLSGCAAFALGSTVYKSLAIPSMTTYGNDLLTRSINAWNRAKITTSNFNVFETTCDDQNIVAGDADQGVEDQQEMIVTAAAYLFEATGNSEYKNAFDTMYIKTRPYSFYWWGPYFPSVQRALLRYTVTPGSTSSVSNNIRTVKEAQNGVLSITDYTANTDLYRSSMPDAQYHWNSHEVKANAGINNLDFVSFSINPAQTNLYKEVAESYLHWFHGINPMGKVMLTNMYNYGGDSCVNEFYHSWFGNGTTWDNVFTSANGPAPGYLIGGPNKDFSIPGISPPGGQPPQKSYREWNTGWNGVANENSWEITEAGIYTQAAYISLLVRVIANNGGSVLPSHILSINVNRVTEGTRISWQVNDVGNSKQFEVLRSTDGLTFSTIYTVQSLPGKKSYTLNDDSWEAGHDLVYYRIRETDMQGNLFYSSIIKLHTGSSKDMVNAFPNPANQFITLNGFSSSSENIELHIYDANARIVKRISWKQTIGSYSRTINIQELPVGIYTFDIKGTTVRQKLKISKL